LRVFRANPIPESKEVDGGALDVTFGIPRHVVTNIIALIQEDLGNIPVECHPV
jgi:hypothetical protein